MIIPQEKLIKEIARKEGITISTVRRIFQSAEEQISLHLAEAGPIEPVTVKVLNGISLEASYIPEQKVSRGAFQNVDCPEHIRVKAAASKYYSRKLNSR